MSGAGTSVVGGGRQVARRPATRILCSLGCLRKACYLLSINACYHAACRASCTSFSLSASHVLVCEVFQCHSQSFLAPWYVILFVLSTVFVDFGSNFPLAGLGSVRTATKRAGGTVSNHGGSPGKRLGVKKFSGASGHFRVRPSKLSHAYPQINSSFRATSSSANEASNFTAGSMYVVSSFLFGPT